YLAPSAAVMAVDDASAAVLDLIALRAFLSEVIVDDLAGRFPADVRDESLDELVRVRALRRIDTPQSVVPQ
ncbi:MAG: hypothetical protein IPL75_15890, partial [Acidobacteria bacterium]|nr:hypothetical protein [Acidobacteriota bacterium]